jgi:hypothetical protein
MDSCALRGLQKDGHGKPCHYKISPGAERNDGAWS